MKSSFRLAMIVIAAFAHAPLKAQQPQSLRLVRDLRIDAAEQDLSPIAYLAVAPNGTIAVTQNQDRGIRFFDSKGASLGSFGRRGQGPGEFQNVGQLTWIDDTLVVTDRNQRRFTLISPDRKLVRTTLWLTSIAIPAHVDVPPGSVAIPFILLGDRSQVVSVPMNQLNMAGNVPSPDGAPSPIIHADSSGAFRRLITSVPASNDCSARFGGAGIAWGYMSIPYCAVPLEDAAMDGSRFSMAYVEPGKNSYRVVVARSNGETMFARSFSYQPVAIPAAVKDSVKARSSAPGPRAAAEKLPEFFPPLAALLAGRDESTWIELFSVSGERTWQVLDGTGNLVAQLKVPRNVRIKVASRDAIWATETDDDGLQHIVRYRVTR